MNTKSKLLVAGAVIATGLAVAGTGFAATPKKTPADKAQAMLTRFDTNKDGVVTMDEVVARADARFMQGDLDKDGKITRAELDTVLSKAPEKKRIKLMKRYDLNQDGAITKAEVEERAKKRFARYDGDKDGKVTKAEAESYITARRAKKA